MEVDSLPDMWRDDKEARLGVGWVKSRACRDATHQD